MDCFSDRVTPKLSGRRSGWLLRPLRFLRGGQLLPLMSQLTP